MIMLLHMPLLSYIPDLLLVILGNINTVVVVVYQVEPKISFALILPPLTSSHVRGYGRLAASDSPWHSM
jgi:hypothetical protein